MTNSSISQLNQKMETKTLIIDNGWFVPSLMCSDDMCTDIASINNTDISHCLSPHYSHRGPSATISLLVVHNISLPPGKFGSQHINDFFQGCLNKDDDPYFETIHEMKVSAHCLIRRDGELVQYVSFLDKAWHAGISIYKGRENCNEFSIGIELEGTDDIPYTEAQYKTLALASLALKNEYPEITDNITGHSDIAPGRKTDPGDSFNWRYFLNSLNNFKNIEK